MLKQRNSPDSLFRAQKIGVAQMVLINSGQNDSYIMTVKHLKCLENTEGAEPNNELPDCNFHRGFSAVFQNTKLVLIAEGVCVCVCRR